MTDLSGPPPSMTPRFEQNPGPNPPPPGPPGQPGNFDLNYPTIISLLYLSSFLFGITALVGVILAYVWRGEPHEDWMDSHYQYLINTFWIGLIGSIVSTILIFVLIGIPLLLAVIALTAVRSVLSLVRAQKREPMPNPQTWLA